MFYTDIINEHTFLCQYKLKKISNISLICSKINDIILSASINIISMRFYQQHKNVSEVKRMQNKINEKQQKILDFLNEQIEKNGYPLLFEKYAMPLVSNPRPPCTAIWRNWENKDLSKKTLQSREPLKLLIIKRIPKQMNLRTYIPERSLLKSPLWKGNCGSAHTCSWKYWRYFSAPFGFCPKFNGFHAPRPGWQHDRSRYFW